MIIFDGLLHVSSLGWEVRNDMKGQYNDSLGVCNVKIRKCVLGWKWGMSLKKYPVVLNDFIFFVALQVTMYLAVWKRFWQISSRSRFGTWVYTWSIHHSLDLG